MSLSFKKRITALLMVGILALGIGTSSNRNKESDSAQHNQETTENGYKYDELYAVRVTKDNGESTVCLATKEVKQIENASLYKGIFNKYKLPDNIVYYGYRTSYCSISSGEEIAYSKQVSICEKAEGEEEKLIGFYKNNISDVYSSSEVRYFIDSENNVNVDIVSNSVRGTVEVMRFMDVIDPSLLDNSYSTWKLMDIQYKLNNEGNSLSLNKY